MQCPRGLKNSLPGSPNATTRTRTPRLSMSFCCCCCRWRRRSFPRNPAPTTARCTTSCEKLKAECAVMTALLVSSPMMTHEMERELLPCAIARMRMPTLSRDLKKWLTMPLLSRMPSAMSDSSVTGCFTDPTSTSLREMSSANSSVMTALAAATRSCGMTTDTDCPCAACSAIQMGMPATSSTRTRRWPRLARPCDALRRRMFTRARFSKDVMHVGRPSCCSPSSSMIVPGRFCCMVWLMRMGIFDSISGSMVRVWNMRVP
mmetsp:Transcript_39929/g.100604  ORF Transcript_39929/g.100604 Transcript_39929/m.100604 type:complete len:261 (-) Transcript_39929:99-881(-)